MTEIPEHLLRRSRERRAALSGESTATEEAAAATAETPRAAAPVPAESGAPETQAGGGAAGGGVGRRPPAVEPEAELPRLRPTRIKTPLWIMPVLVGLPLWGVLYLGAFGNRTKAAANDPVVLGGQIFAGNCSSCHGANGEGGVGPQLNNGEVLRVWPKLQDHLKWVHTGGAPYVGRTIGATNIPVPANNVMPAFGQANGGSLSDQQIADVVCYERVDFGGGPESSANCPATG